MLTRGFLAGYWALDPIDGTKGFLRGGQYAVCLGLIVDGEVVVGVTGCPNLPVDFSKPEGEKGVLFTAVKGHGAFSVRPLRHRHASFQHHRLHRNAQIGPNSRALPSHSRFAAAVHLD